MRVPVSSVKRCAVVLVKNDIVHDAVAKALSRQGYESQRSFDLCGDAKLGVVCSFFVTIGVINQIYSVNPDLRLVMIVDTTSVHAVNAAMFGDFYDVIMIDGHNQASIEREVDRWFADGKGKQLTAHATATRPRVGRPAGRRAAA